MDSINRRKSLLLLAGGLSGCTAMTTMSTQAQSKMVVDDGTSEITPVYVMTHNEGEFSTFVRADFYFYDDKKEVELRPDASIKVNGIELQRDPKELVSYIGRIPMPHGLLTFEFTRAPGKVIKHSFALPELDIVELPKTYRVGETLTVGVNHRSSRAGVMRDTYGLHLQSSSGRFPFTNGVADQARIVFKPILDVGFASGPSTARIYRQQRTPLRDLSSELQTGWAVASRSRDFTIEVVS